MKRSTQPLHNTSRVYQHILQIGWDHVQIEQVAVIEGTREELLFEENKYITQHLGNAQCLNTARAKLNPDEKHAAHLEACKKHHEKNREARRMQSREYYYQRKYGMSETAYKASDRRGPAEKNIGAVQNAEQGETRGRIQR
jgi:hypothetical protein